MFQTKSDTVFFWSSLNASKGDKNKGLEEVATANSCR